MRTFTLVGLTGSLVTRLTLAPKRAVRRRNTHTVLTQTFERRADVLWTTQTSILL